MYNNNIKEPPVPENELQRLQLLYDYNILDTEAEEEFDALTRLASFICGTEIALITLLDAKREWYKSKVGLQASESPRHTSFCQYTILSDTILEVEDAQEINLFRINPYVVQEPHIRFYAGAPLITPSGHRLGTLCVMHAQPKSLTDEQRQALQALAHQTVMLLEKRRQQKLLEQDSDRLSLFKMLFNHGSEVMCILDIKSGKFIEVNPAFEQILGYTPADIIGQPISNFLYEDDFHHLKEVLVNLPHHVPLELESRFHTRSGDIKWLAWTASGQDGKWFATGRDVTRLKKSGSEKVDIKDLLVSVLDNSPVGVYAFACIHTPTGEIIDFRSLMVNRAAEKIAGVKANYLIGEKLLGLFDPDEREPILKLFTEVVKKQCSKSLEIQYGENEQAQWYHIIASPLLDDGLVVVIDNVSSRKLVELQLKHQRTFYEGILNQLPSDIAVLDAQHRYLFLNPAAMKDDETRTWLVGKDDFDYCRFYNKDTILAEEKQERYNKALTDKRQLEWEECVVQPTGETIYCLRHLTPVFNEHSELQYLIEYGLNITDRKKTEQELIAAKEQAEESMRAKEMFLSMMSHEIRTPLNAVIGMSHILLQENPKPEQIENLKTLQFSGENLLTLINDILDFSKIEAGMIMLEAVDFSLKEVITNIRQTFSYRAKEQGIRLLARIDASLPDLLVGDPVRLNQILMNLVSNAIKFTQKGSVIIDVTLENEDEHQAEIIFAVTDTGIGIPADKQDLIFESFTQANSDTTRKFGGSGLGLTITKRLVELKKGSIAIDSQEGKGTTFTVTLKFKKSNQLAAASSHYFRHATSDNLSHLQVLLVEDHEVNQLVATKFLQTWGIKPDYAINGLEAFRKIQQRSYDLVLMDLQMPEMDGYQATRAIRNLGGSYAQIPIIALTASAMVDVREKVLYFGMNDYLTKPFNPNELYQKILRYAKSDKNGIQTELPLPNVRQDATGLPVLLNLSGIQELTGNDKNFLQKLLRSFITSFQEFMLDYEQNVLRAPDMGKFKFMAHKIKTIIKMIHAQPLAIEIEQVEKLLLAGITKQQAQESVNKVQELSRGIIIALETYNPQE